MRVVLIGLGGIGTNLVEVVCRSLVYSKSPRAFKRVLIVDGDIYEPKNRERQIYSNLGNKAEVKKIDLQQMFPELEIEAKPHYVDENNIFLFIREGDIVLSGVDNHPTRKVIADHVRTLENVLLISGGNETYDGNVQVNLRIGGKDITPPITHDHPEIENPKGQNPAALGCGELIAKEGATQLLAVNFHVASLMLNALTLYLEKGEVPYYELYFDIQNGGVRPIILKKATVP